VQPKRFGNGATAKHASPHPAAHSRQAGATVERHIAVSA
jgi:hypothetical protein